MPAVYPRKNKYIRNETRSDLETQLLVLETSHTHTPCTCLHAQCQLWQAIRGKYGRDDADQTAWQEATVRNGRERYLRQGEEGGGSREYKYIWYHTHSYPCAQRRRLSNGGHFPPPTVQTWYTQLQQNGTHPTTYHQALNHSEWFIQWFIR